MHLPSGGSLVIDRTEAMTVVDVNTGKYTGSGGNLEETVTKNNLEAAEEMVRQLRLRDIGGIIVIDFIDMVLESNRELVLRRLTEALGRDRTRHQVAEVTSLGLVQMTRKRMGTGLVEAFSEPCPHCGGRGIVLHDVPVAAAAVDEGPSERRSGKTRRTRGNREPERVEEIVPRVVEPVGRRPDPRGPKPPTAGRPAHEQRADLPVGAELSEVPVLTGLEGIEAAVSAGIQAAMDADDDGERHDDHRQDSASVVDQPVDGARDDAESPAGEVAVVLEDAPALEQHTDEPEEEQRPVEQVAVEPPATAPEPRRRRRAAGRPTGDVMSRVS